MIPRLNLIAEKATTYIQPTATSGEGWIFDKEKFSEMIIYECIHAVEKHNAQAYQVSDPKNISQIIQDHFKNEKI
jgi:hypothetical protein